MKARVFVSSAIHEFREERRIAKDLPLTHPFLEMWVFEEEGASSASIEQSYQSLRTLWHVAQNQQCPFMKCNCKVYFAENRSGEDVEPWFARCGCPSNEATPKGLFQPMECAVGDQS